MDQKSAAALQPAAQSAATICFPLLCSGGIAKNKLVDKAKN
jgi:hypothetical protein